MLLLGLLVAYLKCNRKRTNSLSHGGQRQLAEAAIGTDVEHEPAVEVEVEVAVAVCCVMLFCVV